jgi:tetratricopeptide (TPR) repeat protein
MVYHRNLIMKNFACAFAVSLACAAGVLTSGSTVALRAMAGKPAAQTAEAAEVSKAIDSARAAKVGKRADEAINTLAAVLKKYPGNQEAATFQVTTLAELERLTDALATYDAYANARKRQDAGLLAPIARADLRRTVFTQQNQPIVVARALERQARDGDAGALKTLRQLSPPSGAVSPATIAPTIALVRLKDPAGEAALATIMRSPQPLERAQGLQALTEADVRAADVRNLVPRVIESLTDPDVNVRNAAATALGTLQAKEAIPQLKTAFNTDAAAVKMFAAVALRRLGDTSVDPFLTNILNGPIAELRIIVAGAYASSTSKNPQWDKAVRTLMGGPNEQIRLQAAELLACCDLVAARGFLTSAIANPNPLMRAGAAKALEARKDLASVEIARKLLGDATESVRIHGAGLALAFARDAAPARGRGGLN